jgi:hypothetical protein
MERHPSAFINVEARSEAAFRLKIAARKAAGWILDGEPVTVTKFTRSGRSITGFSQSMYKPSLHAQLFRWQMLR